MGRALPRFSEQSLSRLRGILHECVEDEGAWPEALSSMAEAIGATGALLGLPSDDPQLGLVTDNIALNIDTERLNAFAREIGEPSPWLEGLRRAGGYEPGTILVGDEICARAELEASAWFRDVFEPCEISDTICASFRPPSESSASIAILGFHRPKSLPRFDGEDARRLAAFAPDVECAGRSLFAMRALRRRASTFEGALMVARAAVFIVDARMAVHLVNEAAESLLRLHGALSVRDNRLVASPHSNHGVLEAAVGRTLRDLRESNVLLPGSGRTPLLFRITPIPSGGFFPAMPCALIVALDLDLEIPREDLIAHGLKLTQAEARVAHAIASSQTVAATADKLGVAEGTVRSHLKSIFQKLGIRRQAELVRLVGALRFR